MPNLYTRRMTDRQLIRLFRDGLYRCDPTTGHVFGPRGELPLRTFPNHQGRLFVRIYRIPNYRTIAVSRVVWMSQTLSRVPREFEIHHRDGNPTNNSWQNLYCLHVLDHRKLHTTLLEKKSNGKLQIKN